MDRTLSADQMRTAMAAQAIRDLAYAEAAAIDDADWPLLRSVLADSFELDYSSWRPGSSGPQDADAWVERVRGMREPLDRTRHALNNVWVTVEGNRAELRADLRADHVLDMASQAPQVFTITGIYRNQYRSTGAEGWRLTAKRLDVTWTEGDRAIVDGARHGS